MPKAMKFKDVVKALNAFGYYEARQKGSHVIFKNSEGKITVVPKHSNKEVVLGTVGKICKDIDVPFVQFEEKV